MVTLSPDSINEELVYLAEFQVRLLLCRPSATHLVAISGSNLPVRRLHWSCGCAAVESEPKRYAIRPCAPHHQLLSLVKECDEATHWFDSATSMMLQDRVRMP
jgi:hypothetical protein